jgi:plastocyanin
VGTLSKTILGAAAAVTLAFPSSANAVGTPVIVSGPGSTYTTYTQPVAVVQQGDEVMYVNADVSGGHDVVSRQYGPDLAAHCFRRIIPLPTLGTAWNPSQGQWVYVRKDNPNQTTTDPALAAIDPVTGEPIRARAFPVGACPMIYTQLIFVSEQYPLEGLDNVAPGQIYDYFCSIHGNMFGKLAVLPET